VEQAIEAAAKAGMGVVAMKVMAGGSRNQKLGQQGAMLAALKWVTNHPSVATTIPSMTDMDQLDENVKAMAGPLTADDTSCWPRTWSRSSRSTAACAASAMAPARRPAGCRCLALPHLRRWIWPVRAGAERYLQMASEHVAARCGDCAECTVKCPHGVHVSKQMARAQELFA